MSPGTIADVVHQHQATLTSNVTYFHINVLKRNLTKVNDDTATNFALRNTTVLLKDGACKVFAVSCAALWATSPRPGSLRKWDYNADTLCVPPVDVDELVACCEAGCAPSDLFQLADTVGGKDARDAMMDVQANCAQDNADDSNRELRSATIRRWAADLGPVARHVFNPAVAHRKLTGALNDLEAKTFDDIKKIAEPESGGDATFLSASGKFKHSHRLLTVHPSAEHTACDLAPALARIGRLIFNAGCEADMAHAKSLMGKLTGERQGLV